MKYLFFVLLSFPLFASVEWSAGTDKFQLESSGVNGYVSKSCLKDCPLKKLIKKNEEKLKGMVITGGKDPASVLCQEVGADVIYLSYKDLTETFCVKGKDVIALSVLLN